MQRVNILIMKNIISYIFKNLRKNNAQNSIKTKSKLMNKNEIYIIKTIRNFIHLNFFEISERNAQKRCDCNSRSNAKIWCHAKNLTKVLNISKMISTLIVFVKKQRRALNDQSLFLNNRYRLKNDSSWMKNYHMNVKNFLICHVRDEHDFLNMKKLMKKIIRCKFH